MNEKILKLRKSLKDTLSASRYEHTLGVSFTAMALAMRYGESLEKAEIAGLLHDCAKCYNHETIIKMCKERNIPLTPEELQAPAVLHGKLGAVLAYEKYGIYDEEISNAIRFHTTGREEMSLLEKIIYIADYIEPRRDQAPRLSELRKQAFLDLDNTLCCILEDTLAYVQKKGTLDPMSKKAYLYYKKQQESQNNK